MSVRSFLASLFEDRRVGSDPDAGSGPSVNPATGLPMLGIVDVEGNPYGTDLHRHDGHRHGGLDDHWSSLSGSAGSSDADWSSSSWSDASSSWPDQSSSSNYDPSRGW